MNLEKLVKELTLEEKAALCSGITSWHTTPIERLNIPSVSMSDGPHGIRKEAIVAKFTNLFDKSVPATCFPPAVTLASSWNRDLIKKVAQAIANEAKDQEVSTVLGPGINIKRSPLCGRNFEYFSEDPYLTAEMGVSFVEGMQSNGIGTSVKHYAANSQEYRRLISNSDVDERTLREIYLYAFEEIVKRANPYTIMSAYNKVNGVYASQSKYLLSDILKEEWGYKGIVVSDWGAVEDRVEGIRAGLHLEMPSSDGVRDQEIVEAVENGSLDEKDLDKLIFEILEYVFKCDANMQKHKGFKADYEFHHKIARDAASEGAVLLKNDGILPIAKGAKVAVIGSLAKNIRSQGGGSSNVEPRNEVSFTQYLDSINFDYDYSPGYSMDGEDVCKKMLADAKECAKGKDIVLLYIGLTPEFESESYDREHINLPNSHYVLLDELFEVNKNIVVVLTGGSPTDISYLDKVRALLYVGLTGEGGGESNYDLLTGKVNPSGKLAETYPINLGDILSSKYFGLSYVEYREALFVGYRYFDQANKEVRFPFGFGLSYTTFEYSKFNLSTRDLSPGSKLKLTFSIKNTGSMGGSEVAQIYLSKKGTKLIPLAKELKGFEKIYLEPGEEKEINILLTDRSFSFYNVLSKNWEIEGGEYEVLVGSSSRDIKLKDTVIHSGNSTSIIDYQKLAPSYFDLEKTDGIPLADFEILLGRDVFEYIAPKHKEYTMNTCIGELHSKGFSRIIKWLAFAAVNKVSSKGKNTKAQKKMLREGADNIPIRNLYAQSMGKVSKQSIEGLLLMNNGKFFKGLFCAIKGFRTKRISKKDVFLTKND